MERDKSSNSDHQPRQSWSGATEDVGYAASHSQTVQEREPKDSWFLTLPWEGRREIHK